MIVRAMYISSDTDMKYNPFVMTVISLVISNEGAVTEYTNANPPDAIAAHLYIFASVLSIRHVTQHLPQRAYHNNAV